MYTIKTMNAISPVGLAKLPANQFEINNEANDAQGILVRSADLHDVALPKSLLAIARAGAGTNNIPIDQCTEQGIVVFNTPGANANAVAELVIGALVSGSRNVPDAVQWAQGLKGSATLAKDVEKGKKQFVGPELRGKTIGVIGLGAIGARVANAAVALGMEVLGYDPYISIDAAWSLSRSVQHCVTLGDMLPRCDYLTIHVPYLPSTKNTINAQTLAMCKDGVRVLNFARGELVDNFALLDALGTGKVAQFNTPGANANAVAELVIGALVSGSRNVPDAVQWAQGLKGSATLAKDVEKGKKQFVGPELRGKTIGVIGLGAIGARVANAAVALGMEVLGYDPYISIDAAWSLSRSVQHCVTLGDMLPRCDYLTIHVPYLPSTKNTINAQTLAMCKDGVRVLNFARGELVDNFALLDALGTGKVAQYFCDFPAEELLGVKGVYCTPHLGASTPESETNCAVMAANELSDYLKNGNITHSVNLPDVSQPRVGGKRICIIHRNEPGAISAITGILTAANLNIENMVNKGRKNIAYTMLDVTGNVDAGLTAQLSGIDAAIRVRIL